MTARILNLSLMLTLLDLISQLNLPANTFTAGKPHVRLKYIWTAGKLPAFPCKFTHAIFYSVECFIREPVETTSADTRVSEAIFCAKDLNVFQKLKFFFAFPKNSLV